MSVETEERITQNVSFEGLNAIKSEVEKEFLDAIWRTAKGETETAEQVWEKYRIAQDTPGFAEGFRCVGFLNELYDRGQIDGNPMERRQEPEVYRILAKLRGEGSSQARGWLPKRLRSN